MNSAIYPTDKFNVVVVSRRSWKAFSMRRGVDIVRRAKCQAIPFECNSIFFSFFFPRFFFCPPLLFRRSPHHSSTSFINIMCVICLIVVCHVCCDSWRESSHSMRLFTLVYRQITLQSNTSIRMNLIFRPRNKYFKVRAALGLTTVILIFLSF